MSVNPINMVVDSSGIINPTVVAHVQAQSVNKVAQATTFAEEMAKATIEEEALDKITLQSGQINELSSSEITQAVRDEENNEQNQQEFSETNEDEENDEYQHDAKLHPDPLVGNILNLTI